MPGKLTTWSGPTPLAEANGAPPRRRFRRVRVFEVRRLGPRLVEVTFAGADLAGFELRVPAAHLKVLFPPLGEDEPAVPEWGLEGLVFPEGVGRPAMRTYTARRFDPDTLRLDVEFVLHGSGPGSTWASQVQVGDRAVVAGPGGGYPLDLGASSWLLAGDEIALPAIATILEALPATARVQVLAEMDGPDDEVILDSDADMDLTCLCRAGTGVLAGDLLTRTICDGVPPAEGTRVWVACEASAMRTIRRHLLQERGFDPALVHTRGYWKYGTANHPDHDTGEDA